MIDVRVVYGVSRLKRRLRWARWVGWISWPLATGGQHYVDSPRLFRWTAVRRARRMAENAAGGRYVPLAASPDQVNAREVGGIDPAGRGTPRFWG